MGAHTPGPWLIVEREVQEDDSVYPMHVVGGERLHQVCLLEAPSVSELAAKQPGSMWDTTPTKEANARLIAAAPELLEALEIMVVGACAVGVPHAGERQVLQEAVNTARAAIAKATGSQP